LPSRNRSAAAALTASSAPRRDRRGGPLDAPDDRLGLVRPVGQLTVRTAGGMIRWSPAAASIGRAQPLPRRSGPGNQTAPAPDTEPFERNRQAAAPRRAPCREDGARETRSRKEQPTRNDVSHHFRIRRRSIGRDAAPPSSIDGGRPAVLQHEWLHQLSRGRSGESDRDLSHLRLHPPPSLIAVAAAARSASPTGGNGLTGGPPDGYRPSACRPSIEIASPV
jgi:hypothetical protein